MKFEREYARIIRDIRVKFAKIRVDIQSFNVSKHERRFAKLKQPNMPLITSEIKKQLLTKMLKIRAAEEKIVDVYTKEQQIRTPTHLSIGQEAVAAGLCQALTKEDQVFAGHRCHAVYLAKDGDLNAFFAELCGRITGSSRGRAGSAHLTDVDNGVYSSPILGAMIPVAVGAAMTFQMDQKPNVAVAMFGDGAIEEGILAESLNFAITKKLPILFLCENNLYSTHSPLKVRQPSSAIHERLRLKELKTQQIDGNDVILVYQTILNAIEQIREGWGPSFVECLTYRIREHVGPLFDYDRGYRSEQEVRQWMDRCPVKRYRNRLLAERVFTLTEIEAEEKKWQYLADEAYASALKEPWPSSEDLLKFVY